MNTPSFNDLNKSVKDLFLKGYTHGFFMFDSTTLASDRNVEFQTGASHNLASQKMLGNLAVKYKAPQHGLILTEKWTTDNVLGTVLELKDQFSKGVKLTLDTTYVPHSGKRGGIIKTEWTGDLMKVNADLTLHGGPILMLAGVVSRQDWLFGAQTRFDLSKNELMNTSVAFGRQGLDYTLHSYSNDGREFGASLFHRAHKNVELGAQLSWTMGDQAARFGLATKYRVNNDLLFRAKIDNNAQIALSATHVLGPAVNLTLSTQFGLINEPDNSNKFGVGIEYIPLI